MQKAHGKIDAFGEGAAFERQQAARIGIAGKLRGNEERARRLLHRRQEFEIVDALTPQAQRQRSKTFLLDHPSRAQSASSLIRARFTRSSTV